MFGFQSWIEDEHDVFVAENRNRAMTFIMERSYLEVKKLLARNRSLLDIIALELMEKITLVRSDINRIMG